MHCRHIIVAVGIWACVALTGYSQTSIRLVPGKSSAPAKIAVDGCDDATLKQLSQLDDRQRAQHLQLFVKSALQDGQQPPAVLGSVVVMDKALWFEPRFPIEAGVEYLVRFRAQPEAEWQTQTVLIPKKQFAAETLVENIYPTASELPQNLLKFYIYFTAPMTQGDAYRNIELWSSDGKRVPYPFLEIGEELWDKSGKRLTLLLDPARVKRGLVPREEDGPILTAGQRYRLVIKSTWLDAHGMPLAKSHTKTFTVGPEDFRQPDPASWKIKTPKAKTRDALTLIMPEAMDHATFARGVTIENSKGEAVLGDFTFSHQETQAHFTPLKDWRPGLYDLRILRRIEDLVGNSIERPFELDRFDNVAPAPNGTSSLTIEIE